MHRIDTIGATANNLFQDASANTDGTVVGADWLNGVQEEIATTVEEAGITLNKGENQLMKAIVGLVYPVGSMYVNFTSNTDPGTLLGFGTWEKTGEGRFIIGVGDNGESSYTANTSGGTEEHKHLTPVGSGGGTGGNGMRIADTWPHGFESTTNNAKADDVASVQTNDPFWYSGPATDQPPWIAAHIWRRIS